jgi:aminodeoxyfutalosine synthase
MDPLYINNSPLIDIYDKIKSGERAGFEDGLRLFHSNDLLMIGKIADHLRRERNGKDTYFTLNQHINPTNICRNNCLFCAFYRKEGQQGGYRLSLDQIRRKLMDRIEEDIHEIHIVGGLDDGLPYDYYIDVIRLVREIRPKAHIKAYTAVEIAYLAERSGKSWGNVLDELIDAGLNTMPGGGAEMFSSRVKRKLFMDKLSAEEWLEIHALAHERGVYTNATMLYGHIETYEERVMHLLRLREAQDQSGGFLAYIPLAFHPENTKLHKLPKATGFDDLKNIAIGRIILDNFPHIKAYWVMLGKKMAQIALSFGADDIDGSVVEEKIYHMAGSDSEQMLTRKQLNGLITESGFIPVERDALYNSINREVA